MLTSKQGASQRYKSVLTVDQLCGQAFSQSGATCSVSLAPSARQEPNTAGSTVCVSRFLNAPISKYTFISSISQGTDSRDASSGRFITCWHSQVSSAAHNCKSLFQTTEPISRIDADGRYVIAPSFVVHQSSSHSCEPASYIVSICSC